MTMKKKLDEVHETVQEAMKDYPEQAGAFMKFLNKASEKGSLDVKTKELISIALSVSCKCEWCIAFHVKNALEAGATKEEIMESCFVAVVMCGGPGLMYMKPVMDALKEFS
jgi:AhpD family alkylhydroperoxidase